MALTNQAFFSALNSSISTAVLSSHLQVVGQKAPAFFCGQYLDVT